MIPQAGLTWRGNPNELVAGYAVGLVRDYPLGVANSSTARPMDMLA